MWPSLYEFGQSSCPETLLRLFWALPNTHKKKSSHMPSTSMPKYTLPQCLVSLSSDNCVPPKKEYGESCTCFYFDILWLMFKFTKEKYIMTFETKLQNPPSCMPQCILFQVEPRLLFRTRMASTFWKVCLWQFFFLVFKVCVVFFRIIWAAMAGKVPS